MSNIIPSDFVPILDHSIPTSSIVVSPISDSHCSIDPSSPPFSTNIVPISPEIVPTSTTSTPIVPGRSTRPHNAPAYLTDYSCKAVVSKPCLVSPYDI